MKYIYRLLDGNISRMVELPDGYVVAEIYIQTKAFGNFFEKEEDAGYSRLLEKIENEDFNLYQMVDHPNYEYYLKRLKKEHPEYLI